MIRKERLNKQPTSVLAGLLVLFGCSLLIPFCAAAKDVISETRNVDMFHSVDFRGHGYLHLIQGKESGLRLEGEKDLLEGWSQDGLLYFPLQPIFLISIWQWFKELIRKVGYLFISQFSELAFDLTRIFL